MNPQVKVVMTAHGRGEVYLDGEKVGAVREITFEAGVNQPNRVLLEVIAESIEIESAETEVCTNYVEQSE